MSGNTIQLNLINASNNMNNDTVLIYQKNVATDFAEIAVAWRVIKNLGHNDYHPFTFTYGMSVSAMDSYGNYTPQLAASPGDGFQMTRTASGDVLAANGPSSSVLEVQVENNLSTGSIDANVYRDGKLLAVKSSIPPAQKAVFEFKPTIWIGVASQIEEGAVLNSATLSQINTEISLLGIASADIIWSGGGTGATATPYTFSLQNVVMA